MFHLERIDNPILLMRANQSKEEFVFGDKFDFTLIVEILSPTHCYVKGANGKDEMPIHCYKKFLKALREMNFETVFWEHKGKPKTVHLKK